MKSVNAYDLDVAGAGPAAVAAASGPPAGAAPHAWSEAPPSLSTAVRGSLSLFVPGAGQLIRGEIATGLFFASWVGFLATLIWAVLGSFDRLAPTLDLLGHSATSALWGLGLAYVTTAALHVCGVFLATVPDLGEARPDLHPAVPAVASAVVPGWGQLLNGDRVRAAVFLALLWCVAALWITGSEPATRFLNAFLPAVPSWEQVLRRPLVVWTGQITLPALIWAVAVYDAATSAASRR